MNKLRHLSEEFPVILGSGSPRRKDLLEQAGIPFSIVTTDVPEDIPRGEAPDTAAKRLSALKAYHVSQRVIQEGRTEPAVIISADTIVWHNGECLGKPENETVARELLHRLRGETHSVFTAVTLSLNLSPTLAHSVSDIVVSDIVETGIAETKVAFKNVSDDQIERYIATGDPLDKAGAYGAQELGAFLVDHISGELDTVIGFPLALVDDLAGLLLTKIPRD